MPSIPTIDYRKGPISRSSRSQFTSSETITSEIISSKVKIYIAEAFTRNESIARIKTACEKMQQKK